MAWNVTTAGSALEFDTTLMLWPAKPIAVDTNHFFVCYGGAGSDGFAEVLTVNTSTWAVTTAAARLEHDTQNGLHNSVSQIDTNHFIDFYLGSATTTDGWAQVFTVNTSTWAVTTASARFLFDTDVGSHNSSHQVDANHFLNFWGGASADGFAQTFTVNTSTWAVTTASTQLEFDTQNCTYNSSAQIDTNHFVNVWLGGATTTDLRAQVFTVNTSTWAVTTAAATLLFDTDVGSWNSVLMVDSNHFINFWTGASGDGFAQVLAINTSTWAVTTAAAQLEFDTQDHITNSKTSVAKVDTNHFIHIWAGPDTAAGTAYDGFAQIFEVNTTTWAVTTSTAVFEFETTQAEYNSISAIIAGTDALTGTGAKFLNLFSGSGDDGFAQVLSSHNEVSPTVALNSPADASSDSDTTPTLDFTGTDVNSDDVRYQVQIHTDSGFNETPTNNAIKFDGSSEYAKIDNFAAVDALTDGVGTVEFWVKNTATSVAYSRLTNTENAMSFSTENGTGNEGFNFEYDYSTTAADGYESSSRLPAGVWTHIALVFTLNNPTKVYINGTENSGYDLQNTPSGTPISWDGESFWLGTDSVFGNYFDGSIGGFYRVWKDVRTAGEISANYQTHIVGDSDLIVNCMFLEGSGTTIDNEATANEDMDLYNTPTWVAGPTITSATPPLIDVVSGTDSGFANPDNGGDTDPFTSGDNIQFTVQGGDALSLTTYYWRVRGIDPSGSNTYGAWSSTRSFTVTSVTSAIKKLSSIAQVSLKKISGVAIASVKKVSGVANT